MGVHIVTTKESAIFAIVEAAKRDLLSGQVEREREAHGYKDPEDLEKFKLAYLETLQKLYQGYTLIRPCFKPLCPHCHDGLEEEARAVLKRSTERDFVQAEVKPALVPCAEALQTLTMYEGELPEQIWRQIKTAYEALRAFKNKHTDLFTGAPKP